MRTVHLESSPLANLRAALLNSSEKMSLYSCDHIRRTIRNESGAPRPRARGDSMRAAWLNTDRSSACDREPRPIAHLGVAASHHAIRFRSVRVAPAAALSRNHRDECACGDHCAPHRSQAEIRLPDEKKDGACHLVNLRVRIWCPSTSGIVVSLALCRGTQSTSTQYRLVPNSILIIQLLVSPRSPTKCCTTYYQMLY